MAGGGGGGSTQINYRVPSQEKTAVKNWTGMNIAGERNYVATDPLLSTAQTGALGDYGTLQNIAGGLTSDFNQFNATAQNPDTPYVENQAAQQARVADAAAGILHTPASIANEALNRQNVLDQRRALYSQLANASGGLVGALKTTGQNILTGVGNAAVGQYSALSNPILAYLGNLYQGNLQGSIAQAQLNQQANLASQNKTAGGIGGGISAIGSIAGAAL